MVVFIKKMSLFLLTLVTRRILSMLINRLQVPEKNIQITKIAGENVKLFKYLKLSMDKYVFHSNFEALDMGDVDIVLGYPWIESVGTININVQNNFLKLWYEKKKITLQDVSLSKIEGPTTATTRILVEFEVESEVESIKGDEAKPHEEKSETEGLCKEVIANSEVESQEGHNKYSKEISDSKGHHGAELNTKEKIPIVMVYLHPHHIEKQQSSRQGHPHTYAPAGNQKGIQSSGAWIPTNTTGRHQAQELMM
jgi:hypothetical protein